MITKGTGGDNPQTDGDGGNYGRNHGHTHSLLLNCSG